MFGNLIKKTDVYKRLCKINESNYKEKKELEEKVKELTKQIESFNEVGPYTVEEGNSSILFEINEDLEIKIKSRINEDITNTLIDKGYLAADQSANPEILQLAFVLLVNEASEQIIEQVNENENKFDS